MIKYRVIIITDKFNKVYFNEKGKATLKETFIYSEEIAQKIFNSLPSSKGYGKMIDTLTK